MKALPALSNRGNKESIFILNRCLQKGTSVANVVLPEVWYIHSERGIEHLSLSPCSYTFVLFLQNVLVALLTQLHMGSWPM